MPPERATPRRCYRGGLGCSSAFQATSTPSPTRISSGDGDVGVDTKTMVGPAYDVEGDGAERQGLPDPVAFGAAGLVVKHGEVDHQVRPRFTDVARVALLRMRRVRHRVRRDEVHGGNVDEAGVATMLQVNRTAQPRRERRVGVLSDQPLRRPGHVDGDAVADDPGRDLA